MPVTEFLPVDGTAEVAIGRVLAAEREARDAVQACRQAAEAITAQAQIASRRIAERCERRLANARGGFERSGAAAVAALDADAQQMAIPQQLSAREIAAIDRAVRALAEELTGNAP
jgi:hypothetical protein